VNRLFRKFRKKIAPSFFLSLLTIQNFLPLSILFSSPAQAQIHLDSQVVSADFSEVNHQLTVKVAEPLELEYLVEYQDTEGITQAIQGKTEIVAGGTKASVYFGTCSTTDCLPAEFETGKLIFPGTDYQADFSYKNGVFWLNETGVFTVNQVELGKTYTAPQNDQVQVTFTQLPANPGSLSIQEVYLSDEQVEALGAVSNVAYDITSSMENGTFQYDLKLPVPENTAEVVVKYAESVEKLDQATEVAAEKSGTEVVVKELNHFTTYVVTTNLATCPGGVYSAGSCYPDLASALADSLSGDVIEIQSNLVISQEVNVNVDGITIDGKGWTVTSPFARTTNSNNSAFGIYGDNITIKDLVVDGTGGTNLHGINIYLADNVTLNNVTVKNYRSGVVVNGSNVIVEDITTSGNAWHGINVDLGGGVTDPASLTINGTSNHTDAVHVYADHYSTKPITITDTNSQYDFDDGVTNSDDRLYMLKSGAPVVKDIHFTNSGTPTVGGTTSSINLEVSATYPTYGVDRVRFRFAPPGETCKAQYTLPYFNNIGDGVKNGDLYAIDWDVTGLTSGEYTACALMHRGSGAGSEGYTNENHAEFEVVVDNTKPVAPTITFPAENQYFNSTPILNDWTDITDDSGIDHYRIEYKYDDGHTFSGFPYRETTVSQRNHTPNNSEQGGVSFRVQAFDGLGNEGAWSEWRHYYFDKTTPTTPVMNGFLNPTLACGTITNIHNTTVDWTDTAEANFSNYEYAIDYPLPAGGFGHWENHSLTQSQYSGSLNEGLHTITVRAKDQAGNYSAWADACTITTDWTAPDVEITTPSVGIVNGIVDIRGSVNDANPHHYWFVIQNSSGTTVAGSGVVNDTTSFSDKLLLSWDVSSLPDGEYTIKLEARDAANNKDSGSVHWVKVTVDNTSPSVDLVFPTPGSIATSFQAVFNENVKKAEAENPANYYLSNWPGAGGSGDLVGDVSISYDESTKTATVNFLNAGWYVSPEQKWGVQDIHDLAGNLQTINPYEEYSTPMVAPVTTDAGIDSAWHNTSVLVDLLCTDVSGSGCDKTYYTTDGSEPTTSSLFGSSFTLATEGVFTIKYFSTDRAGNIESVKTASENVKIDLTKPTSTITTFEPDQSGQTVETSTFDGLIEGTAIDDNSGVDHVLLSVGHYSFEAGPSGMMYWDKDSSSWVSGEVLFQANGAESWSYQLPEVPEGVYTITSHAVDVAGNQENTFVITVVYDKTIPEVTLAINPTNPDFDNGWYKTLPVVTLSATDNYQLDRIEYRWNSDSWTTYSSTLTPPGEGQNILYYRGIDKVGNTTDVGVKEVKYDITAPVDGPLNLKVENITLDSAIGKWEKPANSSDITRYVLSWKHESGDSNGTEVGADDFEHEMKSLYNGEWTLYVKAMDDAGNFKEASVKFRIGPPVGGTTTTEDGTVLGVTVNANTPVAFVGGQVAGATDEEDVESETDQNPTAQTTEDGQVLGSTDEQCSGFVSNLPWIILLAQVLLLFFAELSLKSANKKTRTIVFWSLAVIAPVVYYLVRNEACSSNFIYQWFILPSLAVTVFARLASYFFIEEIE